MYSATHLVRILVSTYVHTYVHFSPSLAHVRTYTMLTSTDSKYVCISDKKYKFGVPFQVATR